MSKLVNSAGEPFIGGSEFEQAMTWVAKESLGSLTPEERLLMRRWCMAGARREKLVEEARAIMTSDCVLQVASEFYVKEQSPELHLKYRWLGLALCACFVLIGFFFAYTTQTRQAEALFHAPPDTLAEFSLSDGSELKLDRGSKIRAHYSTNERNIELIEGEAHFEVAKDPGRRFIVDIDNSKVIAIGTAFNVNSWPGGFSVDVTEGVVEISSALEKQHYRVSAGEGFSYLGADKINRWTFEVDEYKDWRQGVIDAKSMSFAEVVSKLTRYSDVPIKIIDPPIKDYIVVGTYDIYSVDETLKILSEILDLDVRRTDSVIMVARGNSVDL